MSYDFLINSWRGRFGVTLNQISTGLYVAEKTKSKLTTIEHFLPDIISGGTIFDFSTKKDLIPAESKFWGKNIDDVGWKELTKLEEEFPDGCEQNRNRICKKYILPKIKSYSPIDVPYDLVIHLRGGDIFRRRPHKSYIQCPLSYFKAIIEKEKPKRTLLVCEDDKNPIHSHLPKYTNCDVRIGKRLDDDINLILNARTLVAGGISNFVSQLALCSENLKRFYFPVFENAHPPQNTFHMSCECFVGEHTGYINNGQWRRCTDLMLKHNINNIRIKAL
jgi:hypothetical protein